MKWEIPLFKIYYEKEDVDIVSNMIKTGMHWAIGPEVQKFEKLISEYIGTKYALVFNSGTSALHSALIAHDIKKGDEVIVPSFTFISTANSPLFVNAKPVFADIEEKTYGIDPEDVKERISKKTKAIIPIHYGGSPCFIKELKEIADDHDLILIEDAAEAFGAQIKDKMMGTFGDCAMFSFCANKVITTGEGGAIVTDSKEIYERLKLIRSHGRSEDNNYFSSTEPGDYVSIGYNFRLSNILSALGIAQIKKVEKIIEIRRKNAKLMSDKLSKIKGVKTPLELEDHRHVYQLYTIKLEDEAVRDGLKDHLLQKGIMTKVYFSPVHLTRFYKERLGYSDVELPMTQRISKKVLTLPIHPLLTKEEIDYIVDQINSFIS